MPTPKGTGAGGRRAEGLTGWVFALPATLWLLAFTIGPLLILAIYSLFESDKFQLKGSLTLANYAVLFASTTYLRLIGKTLLLAAATALVCLALGFPVAYYLSFHARERLGLLLALTLLPYLAGYIPRVLALRAVLGTNGVINWLLTTLHLVRAPVTWLVFNNLGTVLGLVYAWLPVMIILIYLSLERIHPAVLEAAADLGADPARVLWTVVLPLARPGILGGVLLIFLPAVGSMIEPALLGGAEGALIGTVISQRFTTVMDWSRGSSLSMLLVLILLALAALLRWAGRGVTDDAA